MKLLIVLLIICALFVAVKADGGKKRRHNDDDDDYGRWDDDDKHHDGDYGDDDDDGYGHKGDDDDKKHHDDSYERHGLDAICTKERFAKYLIGGGCVRYVKGYDITGVANEIDLDCKKVHSACDCLHECLKRNGTCASFVWKHTVPLSVNPHRQCTLYSNFNLPPDVKIMIDVANSANTGLIGANPQIGGGVPKCTHDNTPDGRPDHDCVSGGLWKLPDPGCTREKYLC